MRRNETSQLILRRPMKRLALVLLASSFVACAGAGNQEGPVPAPSGPAEIQYDVVRQHAQQFDVDLPSRLPGSQQELAAATYILGHLQLAGYSPALDAVPVSNQVQSSNVIALPPGGREPEVVVAIGYDATGRGRHTGGHLGLLLESARALNVSEPGHLVAFAFIAALTKDESGIAKLARFMASRGYEPELLLVRAGTYGAPRIVGSCGDGLPETSGEFVASVEDCRALLFGGHEWLDPGIAGETRIEGEAGAIGPELFRFLSEALPAGQLGSGG